MYCTKCGVDMDDSDSFCRRCGTATGVGGERVNGAVYNRIARSMRDKKVAGVCAGFARYFGMDVTLVRILWLVLTLWPPGVGLIAYIVCWIVMPRDQDLLPEATTYPART